MWTQALWPCPQIHRLQLTHESHDVYLTERLESSTSLVRSPNSSLISLPQSRNPSTRKSRRVKNLQYITLIQSSLLSSKSMATFELLCTIYVLCSVVRISLVKIERKPYSNINYDIQISKKDTEQAIREDY